MVQPIDYTIKTVDPTEAFTKTLGLYQGIEQGQQSIEANKLTLEAARQKIETDKAAQDRLLRVGELVAKAASPGATLEDVQNAMVSATSTEQYNGLKSIFDAKSDDQRLASVTPGLQAYSALVNGNNDYAIQALEKRRDAYQNSGDTANAQQINGWIDAIKTDKAGADAVKVQLGAYLAADSKYGAPGVEAVLKQAKAPAEIAMGKTEAARSGSLATTAAAEAAVAPQVAQLELQERRARIAQARAATEEAQVRTQAFQDELKRIADNPEVKLTAGSQLTLNKMVDEATTGMTDAERFKGLADKLATSKLPGGIFGSASKFIADTTGQTDLLRSDITRYTNTSVLKQLPPGSASDSDVTVTRGGFPKPNASMKTWASYYRGASVVAGVDAQQKANRAEWLALNGDMGPAKRPMVVDGRQVKPGETLLKYQTRSIRPVLDSVNARLGITGPEKQEKPTFRQPATAGSKPGWGKASIVPGA